MVVWTPPKSPLEFQRIRGAQPHASATRRGIQLRAISRKFSARTGEGEAERQSSVRDLRLLPKPIYRYKVSDDDKQAEVFDGAVFAFVTNGGNPQLFLVIEAVRVASGQDYWRFGCTRRTFAELTVFQDKQEVWSVDFLPGRDMKSKASFHKIRTTL